MDPGKVRAALLIASVALLAADRPALPLSDARWLAPGTPVDALLRLPGECVVWPRSDEPRRSVAIGRVAFRAPLLLGGQAARSGLSCASCHRNGRSNPNFHFPGISGRPGTADVTASILSSHRGDGQFNPKPIPDLAQPGKVSRDATKDDLERFIRGLIVEEFDGAEPPAAVLRGLASYVRSMDAKRCAEAGSATLAHDLSDAKTAFDLAQDLRLDDWPTARLMLAAARSALGRIDERFSLPGMRAERAILRDASVELGALQAGGNRWETWAQRWPSRQQRLLRTEGRSLYAADVLRRQAAIRG